MPNLLFVHAAPDEPLRGSEPAPLVEILRHAGHNVACVPFEGAARTAVQWGTTPHAKLPPPLLCDAFRGTLPDLLLADVSPFRDAILPLRHLRKQVIEAWGEDAPWPPTVALVHVRHLAVADWFGFVDDFLAAPPAAPELIARLGLLLFQRRFVTSAANTTTLSFADVSLDLSGGQAFAQNDTIPLPLTPREFDLLRFLLTHRGKFFSRSRLLDFVWGTHFDGGERTVDIHIRRLRSKLPPATRALLETRRGVGYGVRAPLARPGL